MPAIDARIQVDGLKELRKALKAAGQQFPAELRATNKRVAEQIVVPAARERGGRTFTDLKGNQTKLGSAGVASIRALATQTRAQVAMGGARVPWAMGMEWGSKGKYRQFPAADRGGHILYPVVKDKQEEIRAAYARALDVLSAEAFPD